MSSPNSRHVHFKLPEGAYDLTASVGLCHAWIVRWDAWSIMDIMVFHTGYSTTSEPACVLLIRRPSGEDLLDKTLKMFDSDDSPPNSPPDSPRALTSGAEVSLPLAVLRPEPDSADPDAAKAPDGASAAAAAAAGPSIGMPGASDGAPAAANNRPSPAQDALPGAHALEASPSPSAAAPSPDAGPGLGLSASLDPAATDLTTAAARGKRGTTRRARSASVSVSMPRVASNRKAADRAASANPPAAKKTRASADVPPPGRPKRQRSGSHDWWKTDPDPRT